MGRMSVLRASALAVCAIGLIVSFQNCSPSQGRSSASQEEVLKLTDALSSSTGSEQLEKAEVRRLKLLDLAAQSPKEALQVALSSSERNQMPAEIQDKLEQSVQVKGKLEMYYEDYPDGRHVIRNFLMLQDRSRYEIRMSGKELASHLLNKIVTVKGLMIPRNAGPIKADLVIGSASSDIYLHDGVLMEESVAYDIDIVSPSISKGEQRTLAILVNFQNDPNNKPWSVASIQDLMFNSVDGFFLENSSNQTWLTGHVAGWYTLPIDNTNCDGFGIESKAKAAASSDGYVLSNYSRFVFIFPQNTCGYSGMGQVGALPSSSWIHNSANLRTVGHEMSHNMGAYHAHASDCGDVTLASSCSKQEYGDTTDIMGYTGTVGHLNAVYKERLGWFSSSAQVVTVTASGDYLIVPTSVSSNGAKSLKIYAGIDSASSQPYYYHVEFRQPIGYDSKIVERGVIDVNNIFNGLIIHESRMTGGGYYDSYLLDMTPGTTFVDMKDAALTVGNSFFDSAADVTITTLSASSSGAIVRVNIGSSSPPPPPPADTTAPSVSVTSPSSGATISGVVNLSASANDNVAIAKVEFYVDGILKGSDMSSPYSVSFDSKTVSNGSHTIMVKAYDSSNNSNSAQISVNVSNIVLDTTPPSVSITSPANGSTADPRTTITIQASASDNVGVTRVEFYVNGSLVCSDSTASYSCGYTLNRSKGALYEITVSAFDASNNKSSSSISISSTSGTGGGDGGGPKGGRK